MRSYFQAAPLACVAAQFANKADRDKDPVIVAFARTPVTKFMGSFSGLGAPRLGAIAAQNALTRAKLRVEDIGEIYMGNVLTAGVGQAPATQARACRTCRRSSPG